MWARHETHPVVDQVEDILSQSNAVVRIFHDTYYAAKWYPSYAAAYADCAQPGASNPRTGISMLNNHCGKHNRQGRFLLLNLREVVAVINLLVQNSYVRFGASLFHQTRGIPMGINPAVFMANYYLFHYEFRFVKQLADWIKICPPGAPAADMHVQDILNMTDPVDILSPHNSLYLGDAALFLLNKYRHTVRFVDDFT